MNAGGSLVIQIATARALGAHTFGSLTLLTSSLVLLTALYTAFVGDSLTVLDRQDPHLRGTVLALHAVLSMLAAGVGYGVAISLGELEPVGAVAFAALVLLWLNEELCRRVLMARLEFWKLAANDAVYVGATLAALAGATAAGISISLVVVVLAMAAGAVVAILVALGQLPLARLRLGRPRPELLREIVSFALWRSLQAGLAPALLFVARVLIGVLAGRATLGRVEAARLLLAPAQLVVNAAGNVLLPLYAAGAGRAGQRVRRASALLIGTTVLVGAVAVAGSGPLSRLVVGPEITVPSVAVLAWALYTCTQALGLPASTALVARRRSRTVFVARFLDALVGLALLLGLLAADHPALAPAALAAARAGSALWLQRLAGRPDPADPSRATATPTTTAAAGPGWARALARERSLWPVRMPMPRLLPSENRWALAFVILPLMLASDYKLRLRDQQATVSGQPDIFIFIEIGVYAAVAAVLLLTVARAPAGRRSATVINLAWIFAIYCVCAGLWSPYRQLALVRGAQLLLTVAIAQTIARRASRRQLHGLAHAFVALVAASVLFGRVHPFPPVSNLTAGRFTWLYVHPVVAGIYAGAATVIVTGYLVRAGRPHRVWPDWVYRVLLVIVGYGLLATQTRGALSGAVVAILLVIVLGARGARRADLLLTIGILATIGVITSSDTILGYLTRGESTEQLATLNDRTNLWTLAYQAFEQKPLTGWGFTASRGIFYSQIGLGGGHNAFINIMVDGGLVGVVLWLAMLGGLAVALRHLWRRVAPTERADLTMLTALVVFLLIDGLTAEHMAAPANVANILLFVLVGWTGTLLRVSARRRALPPPPPPRPRPQPRRQPATRGRTPPGRPTTPRSPTTPPSPSLSPSPASAQAARPPAPRVPVP
ncbi:MULTISPECIES: O-antigen ligase family protein [Pseudofrankia]|uniref:O-antigen ligase family protein n=1 Tax=Pseudofrankia TaxID=2994363 RepID=UPI0002DE22E0|nr:MULTISPECIES: O-antigen ligase family protein [Pseudofrankia]OHV39874.1 polymerase [Pseudofrankia sp. EUN1h]